MSKPLSLMRRQANHARYRPSVVTLILRGWIMLAARLNANTYQFGDFRGRPAQALEQYFDAMLYLANWGTRRLMFRFQVAR